jgi:hypothetical protein
MREEMTGLAITLAAFFLTGCTINVGTGLSEKMSADEQDYFACKTWIDTIEKGEEDPNALADGFEEKDLKKNIEVLTRHVNSLKDVDSITALQVKRLLEAMLEYNIGYLERGELPVDLFEKLSNTIAPERCDELVGWTFELEVPSN